MHFLAAIPSPVGIDPGVKANPGRKDPQYPELYISPSPLVRSLHNRAVDTAFVFAQAGSRTYHGPRLALVDRPEGNREAGGDHAVILAIEAPCVCASAIQAANPDRFAVCEVLHIVNRLSRKGQALQPS
jgi:hypothetical protein